MSNQITFEQNTKRDKRIVNLVRENRELRKLLKEIRVYFDIPFSNDSDAYFGEIEIKEKIRIALREKKK